jgi:predicted KAP-like P-loop ATPase
MIQPADDNLYSSDQPIHSREEDRFNRWPFTQRIAETIARRSDPSSLVLGIYGVWGDGKTSALHLLETACTAHKDIIIVWFNPWHFQSEDQLLRGFFETLADALDKSLSTKVEKIGGILKKYGSLLSLASVNAPGVQM